MNDRCDMPSLEGETAPAQAAPKQESRAIRMRDMPASERPREKFDREGPGKMNNAELLAILLRTGMAGRNAVQIAQEILARFGSLADMAMATTEQLRAVKGVGQAKAVTLLAAFNLARRMAEEMQFEQPLIDQPEAVANLLRERNLTHRVERFQVVLLNTRRRLIRVEELSQGTLDTLLVHPREVFRPAIVANASAMILVHNHPSGDPMPSEEDIKVTRDLIRSGQLLKIEVLDHVILGRRTPEREQDWVSLKELGYFY